MKFSCNKQTLQDGILIALKAITGKTTNPILEGIYLKAKESKLTLIGSDMDVSIETTIDVDIIEEGIIVIDAKMFSEIIRKLPSESEILIETIEKNAIQITCEKSVIKMVSMDGEDYPELPSIDQNKNISIPQNILKNMIKSTSFAIAVDDTRPILQGILFEVKDKKINLVALDGYRLAIKTEYINDDLEFSVVIPGKTLNEVAKILEDSEEMVNITFTENHILFNIGETKIISRLLEGKYINYTSLLPQEYKILIIANKQKLQNCIERASLMAREANSYLIKLKAKEDNLIITSNSQYGNIKEEVDIDLQGEEIEIAFNSKYLLDVLKNMDEENVEIQMTSSVSPCVIKAQNTEIYKYLVLPVRLVK